MNNRQRSFLIESAAQRSAMSSPLRLEIMSQFTTAGGMSIADVARRMGRSASTLYYHFRVLEEAGLLLRAGSRPGRKKPEALYEPIADRFEMAIEQDSQAQALAALKTVSLAFRMAEKDFQSALESGAARSAGKHRNTAAGRFQCRTTRATLAEINQHLRAIEKIFERENRRAAVLPEADQYISFTLALLPLRGRGTQERTDAP